MSGFTTTVAATQLGRWGGETIGWAVVDATEAALADPDFTTTADLTATIDTGTASATLEQLGSGTGAIQRLELDGVTPTADTSGSQPAGVWFFDAADDTLISFLPVAVDDGYAGWPILAPDGIGSVRLSDLRLSALDDVDATGLAGGDALVWDAEALRWVPGSFDGGVESVVAGGIVTVDASDPAHPVVTVDQMVESLVAGIGISVDSSDPAHPIVTATGEAAGSAPVAWGAASLQQVGGRCFADGEATAEVPAAPDEAFTVVGTLPVESRPPHGGAVMVMVVDGASPPVQSVAYINNVGVVVVDGTPWQEASPVEVTVLFMGASWPLLPVEEETP